MGTEGFPADEGIVRHDEPEALAHAVLELAGRRCVAAALGGRAGSDRPAYGPDRADRELGEVLEYLLAAHGAAA